MMPPFPIFFRNRLTESSLMTASNQIATPTSDWRSLGLAYFFFWYFTGITHALLLAFGASGFFPVRQGLIFSLIWLLPLLLFPGKTRAISGFFGVILWLGSVINLGYFAVYRQEFSQSVLFIVFESNPAEASEYLGQYFKWWMPPALIAHTAFSFWLWRRLRPVVLHNKARMFVVSLIVLALLAPPFSKIVRKGRLNQEQITETFLNRMEPALPWPFLIGYAKYSAQLDQMQALLEESKNIPPVTNLTDANAGKPTTLVLLIGESTNRGHMSLYGYPRPTSPKLQALGNQISVFNNVVASRPYTIEMLQQLLTFADQENPDIYLKSPSIMSIMKQAGYRTYWITNQQTLTKRNTMLTSFSQQMDEQVYLNHSRSQNSYQFDGNVLEPLQQILNAPEERKFIIVHLLGTHMRYEFRYPPEFDVFKDKTGLPAWVRDDQVQQINEYDNAVLYNDFVVSKVIEAIEAKGGAARMVYFSDHGEDVYDWPEHNFIGRNEASPTPPMYTVPFLVWSSKEWASRHPGNFNALLNRPYQTSHFIHTWADLSGLNFDEQDASKSLVNKAFKERPQLVGNPGSPQSLIDLRKMLPEN